jgi:hypothetical protein
VKDDISPENTPTLTEAECTMVNLYRTLPKSKRDALMKLVFDMAVDNE